MYAIFFSGEGVAMKVSVEKGRSLMGKYYKIRSTEETEKVLAETTPCHWFLKISVFYMAKSPLVITAFLKKEKSNCFASPPVFPKPCPM